MLSQLSYTPTDRLLTSFSIGYAAICNGSLVESFGALGATIFGIVNLYRYLFTHVLENPNPFVGRGAVHTTDLPFIFHTLGMGGLAYTPTEAEQELSTTMATTWITFAKQASPNNSSIPSWPRYDVATDSYLEFNDVVSAAAGVHTAHCNFWDGIDD